MNEDDAHVEYINYLKKCNADMNYLISTHLKIKKENQLNICYYALKDNTDLEIDHYVSVMRGKLDNILIEIQDGIRPWKIKLGPKKRMSKKFKMNILKSLQ